MTLFSGFTLVSRLGPTSTALTLPDIATLRFSVAGLLLLLPLLHGTIPLFTFLLLRAVAGLLDEVPSAAACAGVAAVTTGMAVALRARPAP